MQADIAFLKSNQLPEFDTIDVNISQIKKFEDWEPELRAKGIDENCSVLYYFSFSEKFKPSEIIKKAEARKEIKKSSINPKYIALSKINKANAEICAGILYVGKTNSNFISRMKHHLGFIDSHTYALQLRHWAIDFIFALHFAKIDFKKEELDYLEQMETVLHYGLHPLLGRSGH